MVRHKLVFVFHALWDEGKLMWQGALFGSAPLLDQKLHQITKITSMAAGADWTYALFKWMDEWYDFGERLSNLLLMFGFF